MVITICKYILTDSPSSFTTVVVVISGPTVSSGLGCSEEQPLFSFTILKKEHIHTIPLPSHHITFVVVEFE